MRSTLKTISAAILILTAILAVFCLSALVDQEGKSAMAVQAAAKSNVLYFLGELQFKRAEQEETSADAAAIMDGAALAASVVVFLLAAIVWLLADANRVAASASETAAKTVSS